jgi:hypothetical protein
MGGLVPQGFAAYARIFHPGYAQFLRWTDGVPACEREGKLRWRELARLRGTVSHPLMQWREVLAGPLDLERGRDGWQYEDAWLGGDPLSWPSLELPNRNYLLFDAPLDAFADAGWPVRGSWPAGTSRPCTCQPTRPWPPTLTLSMAAAGLCPRVRTTANRVRI